MILPSRRWNRSPAKLHAPEAECEQLALRQQPEVPQNLPISQHANTSRRAITLEDNSAIEAMKPGGAGKTTDSSVRTPVICLGPKHSVIAPPLAQVLVTFFTEKYLL